MNKSIRMFGVLAIVAMGFGLGLYTGVAEGSLTRFRRERWLGISLGSDKQPKDVDASQLWKAWKVSSRKLRPDACLKHDPDDQQEQLYGAISGLTASYGDPYTVFFPPADAQVFQEDISGAFEGVGMELGTKDNILTVVAPLKGSPAEKAGIRSGDKVLAIDNKLTDGMAVDDAIKLIRGKKGTTVKLTIGRTRREQSRLRSASCAM
jgi:C-terminal processing protease CtpA/Prc